MGNTIFKFNDLSVDDVNAYRNIDVVYKTYKLGEGYEPMATFDGKSVTVNKTRYFEKFHYIEDKKYVEDTWNELTFTLNKEQVCLCPFCSRPEHISAIVQGAEHQKEQCHRGRRDHYFAQHTFFSPGVYKSLPQWLKQCEVDRVLKHYKIQDNGPRRIIRNPGINGVGGVYMSNLDRISELRHDLRFKHYPVKWENEYFGDW
jgi:hypothetical protein